MHRLLRIAAALALIALVPASAIGQSGPMSPIYGGTPAPGRTSAPVTSAPFGPAYMAPASTLPVDGRSRAASQRLSAAKGIYRPRLSPLLATAGIRRDTEVSPYDLASWADAMCTSAPAGYPPDVIGRACYYRGLAGLGMIDSDAGESSAEGGPLTGFLPLLKCAKVAHMRECALLAEYAGIAASVPQWVASAQREMPAATVISPSPEAEVRLALRTLVPYATHEVRAARDRDREERLACRNRRAAQLSAWGMTRAPARVCRDAKPRLISCKYTGLEGARCTYGCLDVVSMPIAEYCATAYCAGNTPRFCEVGLFGDLARSLSDPSVILFPPETAE